MLKKPNDEFNHDNTIEDRMNLEKSEIDKTSTRVVHRCVYANQENINLKKYNTRFSFGISWLTITCFGFG